MQRSTGPGRFSISDAPPRRNAADFLKKTLPIPEFRTLNETIEALSKSQRALLYALMLVLFASALTLAYQANQAVQIAVPASGGSVTEGVVGTPRFINPLLALSEADRDISALVYAGLLKATANGTLKPELAERYEISDDGLTYTVTLRNDVTFHDGTPVTADDVVFTVTKAKDPALKSPKRANWEGVAVEKIDARTVRFTLEQPYAPFKENLTLGILPKHIWENVEIEQFPFSQFNVEPIGAGPYRVHNIDRNASGVSERYTLKPFANYALGKPYISTFRFRFYANEDKLATGYRQGEVEHINSISPDRLADGAFARDESIVMHPPLQRVFGVFFNQNQAGIFTDRAVRRALALATNRNTIVENVLSGYGTPIAHPVPPETVPISDEAREALPRHTGSTTPIDTAQTLLDENGWDFNTETQIWEKGDGDAAEALSFSIATANTPELKHAAELIDRQWEALGAQVNVTVFNTNDLNQNVIRPRQYDALLFGEIVGRELDLFAFWHSSQRNDPGLNIALYANITADSALEDARSESDREAQFAHYQTFITEVANDTPAVFLYSPDFIYLVRKEIRGIELGSITTPSERFLNVHEWHLRTDRVWPFFADGR